VPNPIILEGDGRMEGFGPDLFQEAEKQVHMMRENLRIAQSRQKSFEAGDYVYPKVLPTRGL
jgi:hypothetical protein